MVLSHAGIELRGKVPGDLLGPQATNDINTRCTSGGPDDREQGCQHQHNSRPGEAHDVQRLDFKEEASEQACEQGRSRQSKDESRRRHGQSLIEDESEDPETRCPERHANPHLSCPPSDGMSERSV